MNCFLTHPVPQLLVIGLGVEVQPEIDHTSDEPLTRIY